MDAMRCWMSCIDANARFQGYITRAPIKRAIEARISELYRWI